MQEINGCLNNFSPNNVIHIVEVVARDYMLANVTQRSLSRPLEDYIKWKPADHGFTKLNFDGSIVSNHSAFIVFVIRDEDGRHVLVGTRKVNAFHVPITETLALREDLRSAMRQHLFKVQVECDSKLIIDCVLNKCSIPWCLKVIIKDIRHLAAQFQEIQFVQIFRPGSKLYS